MKKLLLLLLIPFIGLGQTIVLDHSYTNPESFEVGQTITVKFNMIYPVDADIKPTYMFIDWEFNNKLLSLDEVIFSQGESTWFYTYTGFQFFTTHPNIDELDDKYFNAQAGYDSTKSDWSIQRFSIQNSSPIPSETTLVEFKFTIKDKANTGYSDYLNITNLNWADITDSSTGDRYDVKSLQQNISLQEVKGGDAGSITLNLNTPSPYPTDYQITISSETGVEVYSGFFDENYQAIVSGLENDIVYNFGIKCMGPESSTWIDEVVTVTDAYTNFRQAATNIATPDGIMEPYYDYSAQFLLGEVNNNGNIDSQDSYVMLNHILGESVSEWITNSANGALDYSGIVSEWGVASNEYYFGLKTSFKPSDADKVFELMHAFRGDVDFSHSFVPTREGSKFQKSSNESSTTSPLRIANNAEEYDLDIASSLVEGQVELVVNLSKGDLAGMQFILGFDRDILDFKEVIFDTGNEMTNFANDRNNKLYVGSIDTDGSTAVKTGTPYKLVFTPKQTITNTAGLIYFSVADAVKKDGTKVNLNIQ